MSGAVLATEINRYCATNSITRAGFARASGVPAQTISGLAIVRNAGPATVAKVRAFIAAHPAAAPIVPPPGRSQPDRRPVDVVPPPTPAPLARPVPVVEQIAKAALATPSDLIRHVSARWPEVWAAVIERARADGAAPGAALVAAIERGLGLEVTCG
ncbi:hypothetical protein [Sphingomonas hankookensis]|uniref:hypothetical protein n=1 Tax=Sphingomonas hankookensis TaxID=563996 RepID=UPI003D303A30